MIHKKAFGFACFPIKCIETEDLLNAEMIRFIIIPAFKTNAKKEAVLPFLFLYAKLLYKFSLAMRLIMSAQFSMPITLLSSIR